MLTFLLSYRNPVTGRERTARVEAKDWAEAEAQIPLIADAVVLGELVEEGEAAGPTHFTVGRA